MGLAGTPKSFRAAAKWTGTSTKTGVAVRLSVLCETVGVELHVDEMMGSALTVDGESNRQDIHDESRRNNLKDDRQRYCTVVVHEEAYSFSNILLASPPACTAARSLLALRGSVLSP